MRGSNRSRAIDAAWTGGAAFLLFVMLMAGCNRYPTKEPLEQTSRACDPAKLQLAEGYNDYVQRTFLADGTEVGVISLKDGSTAKYWFRSHHMCKDIGGTWFELSDGTRVYMAGFFCCEVQLPEPQLESLDALRAFIKQGDGVQP